MEVYNSLGRKMQEFKPLDDNKVRMYACGPTVYGLPHIGNYRSFFMTDIIRRYLEFKGYDVQLVMNITDIDDKTIRDSKKEGLSLIDFTRKYEKIFLEGIDTLHIKRASVYPRATDSIEQMVLIIQKLLDKGLAYVGEDGIYYRINKFNDYGKLSGVDTTAIKPGARVAVDEYDKDNLSDFALWKFATPEELEREIFFETPWGKGRPGWHIECSAMSFAYLGESFDIHTGGIDLLFPHHENEIAQSEGAFQKPFVKYWLHGEHLLVNNEKMAKSKGNYFTLHELLKKFDVDTVRYFFLETHYRDKLNYTDSAIENSVHSVEKLKHALQNLRNLLAEPNRLTEEKKVEDKEFKISVEARRIEFEEAMDIDFDTPAAIKILHDLSKQILEYMHEGRNKEALEKALQVYEELLLVLGLFEAVKMEELTVDLQLQIKQRQEARNKGDFKEADKLRDRLKDRGILLDDVIDGVLWRRA